MQVFTIQISRWRQASIRNITFIDTTVKSGYSFFSPTWDIVLGHKNGTVSDEEYTKEYRRLMIASMKTFPMKWEAFLADHQPIALGCYCKPDVFCHRHLLRGLFEELCKKRGIEFLYYGEIQ